MKYSSPYAPNEPPGHTLICLQYLGSSLNEKTTLFKVCSVGRTWISHFTESCFFVRRWISTQGAEHVKTRSAVAIH